MRSPQKPKVWGAPAGPEGRFVSRIESAKVGVNFSGRAMALKRKSAQMCPLAWIVLSPIGRVRIRENGFVSDKCDKLSDKRAGGVIWHLRELGTRSRKDSARAEGAVPGIRKTRIGCSSPSAAGASLSSEAETAYDAFLNAGLIGCAPGLPKDLATNKRHFKGFGKAK